MCSTLRLDLPEGIAGVRASQIEIVDPDRLLEDGAVPSEWMESLHHGRQMRHVACADETGGVAQSVGMFVGCRPEQKRRGVDGPARGDDQRCMDPNRRTVSFHVDRFDPAAARFGQQPACERIGPQRDVVIVRRADGHSMSPRRSWPHADRETSCTCCTKCSRQAGQGR